MIRFTTTARAALLLTFASGVLAAPAFADDDALPQATLNVAHTDFSSAKSVAQLKNRVRRTAYTICTANSDGKGIMSAEQSKCVDTAMRSGLAQIESKSMEARRQTSTNMAAALPEEHRTH